MARVALRGDVPYPRSKPKIIREMPNSNVLVEIPFEHWPSLRDLFLINWPREVLAYSTVKNYIELNKRTPNPVLNSKIYSLNGDWSDGTFILQDGLQVCVYTLQVSCERLKTAMLLFDWSRGPMLHPYDVRHKVTINSVQKELNLNVRYDDECLFYWLPRETAAQFDLTIPEDMYLSSLNPEHLSTVAPLWQPPDMDDPESYMRQVIQTNASCALFGKQNHDLKAWVMSINNGFLMALHTIPGQYRKGYGSIVLRAIARKRAEVSEDTFACILPHNSASIAMFEKLGFKPLERKWWCKTQCF